MSLINHITSAEVLKLKDIPENRSYHVFLDLLKYFKDVLSANEYMDLYYFYTLCEKYLMFARRRELKSAAVVVDQLHAINRSIFPDSVRAGAEANLLACDSYFDYVSGHYEAATAKMICALNESKDQAAQMPAFLASLYEYNLNLIRIAFKTISREEVTDKMLILLQALFFNAIDSDNTLLDRGLTAMDEDERSTWVHYLLDNFGYGLAATKKATRQETDSAWAQLLSGLFATDQQASFLKEQQHALSIIDAYVQQDMDKYLWLLEEYFPDIAYASYFAKKTILSQYLEYTKHEQAFLEMHPNYTHFQALLGQYDLKVSHHEEQLVKST